MKRITDFPKRAFITSVFSEQEIAAAKEKGIRDTGIGNLICYEFVSCNISKIVNVFKVYKEHILEISFVIDERQLKIFKLSACNFGFLQSYIVSYMFSERNDNPLVFKTFDKAVQADPNAHPLFHSDRGFQYTNQTFHHKLMQAGMAQSMFCVVHYIDNDLIEALWGILKRERYYGKRFTSKHDLAQMIHRCICYYNMQRVQHNLGILTPMEKHAIYLAA